MVGNGRFGRDYFRVDGLKRIGKGVHELVHVGVGSRIGIEPAALLPQEAKVYHRIHAGCVAAETPVYKVPRAGVLHLGRTECCKDDAAPEQHPVGGKGPRELHKGEQPRDVSVDRRPYDYVAVLEFAVVSLYECKRVVALNGIPFRRKDSEIAVVGTVQDIKAGIAEGIPDIIGDGFFISRRKGRDLLPHRCRALALEEFAVLLRHCRHRRHEGDGCKYGLYPIHLQVSRRLWGRNSPA